MQGLRQLSASEYFDSLRTFVEEQGWSETTVRHFLVVCQDADEDVVKMVATAPRTKGLWRLHLPHNGVCLVDGRA